MNRNDLFRWAKKTYGTVPEYLWSNLPDSAVLRNTETSKWYAIIMKVNAEKLSESLCGTADIVNVKLLPIMIGSYLELDGFYRAYHMNKENWISIMLDDRVPDEMLTDLLEVSHRLSQSAVNRQTVKKLSP